MICFRKEGEYLKIGLNVCFASNHVAVHWVWFDFARHEGSHRGFTISRRGVRRRGARWNVVEEYLKVRNLSVVHEEVLQDMREAEKTSMRANERYSLIKPGRAH
jgi:hypothetical protein